MIPKMFKLQFIDVTNNQVRKILRGIFFCIVITFFYTLTP